MNDRNDTPGGVERDFADRLAAATPTPGGGAAAARTGLFAASLVRMVTGISLSKAPPAESRESQGAQWRRVEEIAADAAELGGRFRELESADVAAFDGFLAALRLPKADEGARRRRAEELRDAAVRATEVPLATMVACLEVLDLVADLLTAARDIRLRAESDLGAAVELAHAAFRAAELNVRVNLPGLREAEERATLEGRYQALQESLEASYPELRRRVLEWLG